MNTPSDVGAELDRLGSRQRIEELAARLRLPHIPEYELAYFTTLFRPELRMLLGDAERRLALEDAADARVDRGRVRRCLGDSAGASEDFRAALEREPDCSAAHLGLGELALGRPEAEGLLSRSLELGSQGEAGRLLRGVDRLLHGRDGEALKDFGALLGSQPDSALGRLLEGLARERLGDRAGAAASYGAASELDPICSAAYLLRARTAAGTGQEVSFLRRAYDVSPVLGFLTLQIHRPRDVESREYVRKMLSFAFRNPERTGAYYRREATQSHFSHFPAKDYAFVERLAARHPDSAWVQAFLGRAACYTSSGAEEGVQKLSRAIELAPHAGWIHAWRANARRLLRDYEGAEADFDACRRLQPFYHRAFVWRGALRRKLGRFPEALSDLDRALAMDPHYSLVYYERSMTRRAMGDGIGAALDLDRAFMLDARYGWVFETGGGRTPEERRAGKAELDRAVAEHPCVASLWAWRGHLRLQSGDSSGALADLRQASNLDPRYPIARGFLGRALFEAGRYEEAASALRAALAIEPDFWIAYRWLAEVEFSGGRPRRAFAVLRVALSKKGTLPWAHLLFGRFHLEQGRPRLALEALGRALRLDGKYPEAYLLAAQAQLRLGRLGPARRAVEKCLEIAPNMGRAYIVRAKIHEEAGRPDGVIEDYRKALRDFPYLFNGEERARVEAAVGGAG